MIADIEGYKVENVARQTRGISLSHATRLIDGKRVLLKTNRCDPFLPQTTSYLLHEYKITRDISSDQIIKPFAIERSGSIVSLIFEDFEYLSLSDLIMTRTLSVIEILRMAVQIAEGLGDLHTQNLIHRDIQPLNVLLSSDRNQAKLFEFGFATSANLKSHTENLDFFERSLPYISPEQTGRMNRRVDYRTDLYSLGITLFEALAGKLPFETGDPLELVHCHLAVRPPQLKDINKEIPGILSDVIATLLSKNVDDRYQSAIGLKNDLDKCLKQLTETGTIKEFSLSKLDSFGKFQIPQTLYGREAQLETITKSFQKASAGSKEILFVGGGAGAGKSTLIREAQKSVTGRRAFFVEGKYDQFQRDVPYFAIRKACGHLVRILLTESPEILQAWKQRILSAVGNNASVIFEVVPELELILGPQQPAAQLGDQESQNRFNRVFRSFIRSITHPDHMLVIFIDDLQWTDRPSVQLLETILLDDELANILFIGAYRDDEVDISHPFQFALEELKKANSSIQTINLPNLSLDSVTSMVSDAIGEKERKKIHPLAMLIHQKTLGNAFFASEFLKALHNDALLVFDSSTRCWSWDLDRIASMKISDNVVDFLVRKIQELPGTTQDAMKISASIGSVFNLRLPALLLEKSDKAILQALWPAVEEGLIQPVDEGYWLIADSPDSAIKETGYDLERGSECRFKFSHDRIQQASYALVNDFNLQEIHLRIARLLFKGTPEEKFPDQLFDLVSHYNQAIEIISARAEQESLLGLNLMAARKARDSVAFRSALNYLQHSRKLLKEDGWNSDYELTLKVTGQLAEAAFLSGESALMNQYCDELLLNCRSILDKVSAYKVLLNYRATQNQLPEVVDLGLDVLQQLGVRIPRNPGIPRIMYGLLITKMRLFGRRPESLLDFPLLTDPALLGASEIMSSISSAVFMARPNLVPIFAFVSIRMALKHGLGPFTAYGFLLYGIIQAGMLMNFDLGCRFGEVARLVVKKDRSLEYTGLDFAVTQTLDHYRKHIKDAIPRNSEAYRIDVEHGNYEYAGHSGLWHAVSCLLVGQPLDEVEDLFKAYCHALRKYGLETGLRLAKIGLQFVTILINNESLTNLTGEYYNEFDELESHLAANDSVGLGFIFYYKAFLACLLGKPDEFFSWSEKVGSKLDASSKERVEAGHFSFALMPNLYCFDSLLRIDALRSGGKNSSKALRKVAKNQKKLRSVAQSAPMNYMHKYDLVCAELARLGGKFDEAEIMYERAIRGARENGFLAEAGMALERVSLMCAQRGKDIPAASYLQSALNTFQQWGSRMKVNQLRESYNSISGVTGSFSSEVPMVSSKPSETLDVAAVMKAAYAISGEIKLESLLTRLLHILVESAGAERAILILLRNNQLLVEAEMATGNISPSILQGIPVSSHGRVSNGIINFVARSREEVVIADAMLSEQFSTDDYLRDHNVRSVLCFPVIQQGKLIGLIYLENNLAAGVFSPDRLKILQILSAQAAVSFENAMLYENLERKVEERTAEVMSSKKEIDDIMSNVRQGLLTLQRDGRIGGEFSLQTRKIFERDDIGGKDFQELIGGDEAIKAKVLDYLQELFDNRFMSQQLFERINPLKEFSYHVVTKDRKAIVKVLSFNFSRILSSSGNIEKLMVVVEDRSEEFALKQELKQKADEQASKVEKLYQILMEEITKALSRLKDEIHDGNSIFEKILDMGEAFSVKKSQSSRTVLGELEGRLRSIVNRETEELGKKVSFEFKSEVATDFSDVLISKLHGPLSHLVRNSIVHGIESPEERVRRGKNPDGSLIVRILQDGGYFVFICEDDGEGLQTNRIKERAIALNLITQNEASKMSEGDVSRLIFSPRLSTAVSVTSYAGRGVGMDVVKTEIQALGGQIVVASKPGQGTRFTLRIPEMVAKPGLRN